MGDMSIYESNTNKELKVMTVNFTKKAKEGMDLMKDLGIIASVSEYIRKAVNKELRKDMKYIKDMEVFLAIPKKRISDDQQFRLILREA